MENKIIQLGNIIDEYRRLLQLRSDLQEILACGLIEVEFKYKSSQPVGEIEMNDFFKKVLNINYTFQQLFIAGLTLGIIGFLVGKQDSVVNVKVPVQMPTIKSHDEIADSNRFVIIEKNHLGYFIMNSRLMAEEIIADIEEIPGINFLLKEGRHSIRFYISKSYTEKEVFKSINDLIGEKEK